VAGVPLLLTSLLLLASHNIPAAAAVTIDSAVTDVIAGVGFPWAPAVLIVSTGAGVPVAVVVLTPAVFSGFTAVAAITIAVDMLSAAVFSNVSGAPAVVDIPAVFGVPTVDGVLTAVNMPSVNVIYTDSYVPAAGVL